jgi:hypothetical protein
MQWPKNTSNGRQSTTQKTKDLPQERITVCSKNKYQTECFSFYGWWLSVWSLTPLLNRKIYLDLEWFMVFNATFNNISVISWWSVLLVEVTGVSGENQRPAASH